MSGTKDLKDLLDKLKVGLPPPARAQPVMEAPRAAADRETLRPTVVRQDRFNSPYRAPEQRPPSSGARNLVWSENNESILFGMLATLAALMVGVLAGLDYLVLIGTVFFSFISLVMLLTLFRVCLSSKRAGGEAQGALADRVDALSRKVEMLSSRAASGGVGQFSAGGTGNERELEHKVEELRVLVKSLTKAVGLE